MRDESVWSVRTHHPVGCRPATGRGATPFGAFAPRPGRQRATLHRPAASTSGNSGHPLRRNRGSALRTRGVGGTQGGHHVRHTGWPPPSATPADGRPSPVLPGRPCVRDDRPTQAYPNLSACLHKRITTVLGSVAPDSSTVDRSPPTVAVRRSGRRGGSPTRGTPASPTRPGGRAWARRRAVHG